MKIMIFNVARYDYNWQKRKPKIISAVLKENPDILFMQEIFDDQRHQAKDGLHQGAQLNTQLGYQNMIYDIVEQTTKEHGRDVKQLVFDGLLCLTNLKILRHKVIRLKREMLDRHHRAIQMIEVLYKKKKVLFYHTHYSNTTEWSKLHLKETKLYLNKAQEKPIILGDLNILDPKIIKDVLGDKFESSYDFKKYISFPSKNEILDYVVTPKSQYEFETVKCDYDGCSDHRVLTVEIKFNK